MTAISSNRVFKANNRQIYSSIAIFFTGSILGLGVLGFAGFSFYKLPQEKFFLESLIGATAILAIGAYLAWEGVVYCLRASAYRGFRVTVGPDGLTTQQHGQECFFPWGEITEVWKKAHVPMIQLQHRFHSLLIGELLVYTIKAVDGRRTVLRSFIEDLPILGDIIQRETCAYILPASRQAISTGQTLWFGFVAVNSKGIHTETEEIPWRDILGIDDKNTILCRKNGVESQWINLCHPKISNELVLLELVQEFKKGA